MVQNKHNLLFCFFLFCFKSLAVAKFEFFLQLVCSRAETYLFGPLGQREEWGRGSGYESWGNWQIERWMGGTDSGSAAEHWKTKGCPPHSLGGGGGGGESWGERLVLPKETLENYFPSDVVVNIISHLHVSGIWIPFACANLEVNY